MPAMFLGWLTSHVPAMPVNVLPSLRLGPALSLFQPLTMPPAAEWANVQPWMKASLGRHPVMRRSESLSLGPQPKPLVLDSPPPYSTLTFVMTLPVAGPPCQSIVPQSPAAGDAA